MSNSHDHDMLDGCLEELLRGQTPPDLKERILAEYRARQAKARVAANRPIPTAGTHTPTARPKPTAAINGRSVTSRYKQRKQRKKNVVPIVLMATVLVAVAMVTLLIWNAKRHDVRPPVASEPKVDLLDDGPSAPDEQHTPNDGAPPTEDGSGSLDDEEEGLGPVPDFNRPHDAASDQPRYRVAQQSDSTDEEVRSEINRQLKSAWDEHDVRPAQPIEDGQWARRVYLRLIGRIPSVGELNRYVRNKDRNKRAQLLADLLESREYRDQYAEHWADVWTNALIGRSLENKRGRREGLIDFLKQSLAENVPYDEMVRELLTARGENDPNAQDHNGATNFLISIFNDQQTLMTARTCQVFLGQRLQCAQCHDHPFDEKQQATYWQVNAFFRQLRLQRQGQYARLVDRDFRGEVYFERPNGKMSSVYPEFIDGSAGSRSGLVRDVIRRDELADFVVASPELGRAAVNRIWGHLFGYGFTNPIDDMGGHKPVSHPELLDSLAKEFAGHGYDLRRLIKWIASSDAFSLSSQSEPESPDNPEGGTLALFSHYYTRQLQPEEAFRSMQLLAQVSQPNNLESLGDRQKWLAQFVRSLETDEGDEESSFDGNIPQTLDMMNGPLTRKLISIDEGSLLRRVADDSRISVRGKVAHLYRAALSRNPSRQEYAAAEQLLMQDPSIETLQDIWWALLNSSEFILDH